MLSKELFTVLFVFCIFPPLIDSSCPIEEGPIFSTFPQGTPCYKAIGHDLIYLAIEFTSRVPIPPPMIAITVGLSLYVDQAFDSNREGRLFLYRVKGPCTTSLSFSNAKKNFKEIIAQGKITIGFNRPIHNLALFRVFFYPNVRRGWHAYPDWLRLTRIYASYLPNQNEIAPPFPDVDYKTVASYVEQDTFQTDYICIAFKHDVYVIKPNFGNRPRNIPKYQGLRIRVYSNDQPVSALQVSAWPCGDDSKWYERRKPILVVDDVTNPIVFATFDELGPTNQSKTTLYSMEELKRGPYFSIEEQTEFLSLRSDWLNAENRLFLVKQEYYYSMKKNFQNLCYWHRSITDEKILLLYREERIMDEIAGYMYTRHQKVKDVTACDTDGVKYKQNLD